jgi:ribokinase
MNPQVVVVGSFVQDLTWKCSDFPRPGETVVGTFTSGPGGKGSNQAIASGRAGGETVFIGAVGNDSFAREAKAFYRAEGVGARWIVKTNSATGTAGILVDAAGQNQIIVSLGANARLSKTDLDAALIGRAQVLVCQCESNLATTAHALRLAHRAGVLTILNPAPMREDFDVSLLREVDILIPNETEFTALVNRVPTTGRTDFTEAELASLEPAALHALCGKLKVRVVAVTLGARGVFLSRSDGYLNLPAYRVKPIDTTGAGDAFVGGFAAGLVKNAGDLAAAARFGNAAAALSVTKFGTAPAMPYEREITTLLRQHTKRRRR